MLYLMPEPPQQNPLNASAVQKHLNTVMVNGRKITVNPNDGIQVQNSWWAQLDPPREVTVAGTQGKLYVAFHNTPDNGVAHNNTYLYCVGEQEGQRVMQVLSPNEDYTALRPNSNITLRLQ